MRTLTMRRQGPEGILQVAPGWFGPSAIAVSGASGGAGASTLCALLAAAAAELTGTSERRAAIVDTADRSRSPWPDWLSPRLDPALGEEGLIALDAFRPPRIGYPRSLVMRSAGAIRGLHGVAVLTGAERALASADCANLTRGFAVSVQDLGAQPNESMASRFRDDAGGLLLAIAGTADGVAAGIRATRAWAAYGLPPGRIRPVVIAGGAGGLSPRARARLALLDTNTQPVAIVPFDPAISRRGLSEALACGAVGAPTRIAVRRIVAGLCAASPAVSRDGAADELALFEIPAPAAPSSPASAYERTAR